MDTRRKIVTKKDVRPFEIYRIIQHDAAIGVIILDVIDCLTADKKGINALSYRKNVYVNLSQCSDKEKTTFPDRLSKVGNVFWGVYDEDFVTITIESVDIYYPTELTYGVFENYAGVLDFGRMVLSDHHNRVYGVSFRGCGNIIHCPAKNFDKFSTEHALDEINLIEAEQCSLSISAVELRAKHLERCFKETSA